MTPFAEFVRLAVPMVNIVVFLGAAIWMVKTNSDGLNRLTKTIDRLADTLEDHSTRLVVMETRCEERHGPHEKARR